MSYITNKIAERRQKVQDIVEDTYHDWLKAMPGMTIWESFESTVERELNSASDDFGQYQKISSRTIT